VGEHISTGCQPTEGLLTTNTRLGQTQDLQEVVGGWFNRFKVKVVVIFVSVRN